MPLSALSASDSDAEIEEESSSVEQWKTFEKSVMGNFFSVVKKHGKNNTVKCKLCVPKTRKLKTSIKSYSSFCRLL